MRGNELELIMPDGNRRYAYVGGFGIDLWKHDDGHFYTDVDPADPEATLSIAGDFQPEDVPPGTEIWLSTARFRT